jgi:fibro-slime domain-containing protein
MRQITALIAIGLWMGPVFGCSSSDEEDEEGSNNTDYYDGINSEYDTRPSDEYGQEIDSNYNQCSPTLLAIVRDFPDRHPDFHHSGEQGKAGADLVTGMVAVDLGADDKPILGTNRFFSDNLSEWYNTIPDVNKEFVATIRLAETANGVWTHNNDYFFPLGPNQGFGHENNTDGNGVRQNFLFTTELRLRFTYKQGQRFRFKGDDDLWVFINGKLAIDLGGIHSKREEEVDIDAHAQQYGMVPDQQYTMHIFHAERNPVESHFRIETNIECFTSEGPVV